MTALTGAIAAVAALGTTATLGVFAPAAVAAGPRAGAGRIGSAPPGQRLQLVLPLRANAAGLERLANAVTTVGSPQYGDYEPIQTLARRFGASLSDRVRVLDYLHREGARRVEIDVTGLFADATMTVSVAQRLFGTSLARYQSARAARFVAPTGTAHVPAALSGAVTGVVGLDTRPVFGSPQSVIANTSHFPRTAGSFESDGFASGYQERSGTASGCAGAIGDRGFTPNEYLTAYDYAPLQAAGITGKGERVALIEIDGFRYSDLRTFAGCFGLPVPAINGYGVGLSHSLAPGGETTLDLEVLDAAAPGLKEVDVYESRARASDVLMSLTAPLQNHGHVPDVISASLGSCEPELQLSIGPSGARAAEGALALAAASGISVLASSGDAGSSACIGRTGPIDALAVSYPASSPYVTGVGGTNVTLSPTNVILSQPVWNDAPFNVSAGGGGVSGLFTRPSYQKGFVPQNRRVVPDISMLADIAPGYDIYCSVQECLTGTGSTTPWIAVGGTSAAAPLFAGGLALVDELLREHGKQNLGLANSLLYTIAAKDASAGVFYDVTTNDNDLGQYLSGGNHKPLGCCSAGPGFDFASGLGSVDLNKLAFLAAGLQPAIATVGVSLPRQRPVANDHLVAKLSCTRRCIVTASAAITIAGSRPFSVSSAGHVLKGRGRATAELAFSSRDRHRLRSGLRSHKRITATLVGEVLDAGGNVEATSRVHTLRIQH